MIFEIDYILHYKNRNVTAFKKVNGIDRTHAIKIFYEWARRKFKAAKFIEIK